MSTPKLTVPPPLRGADAGSFAEHSIVHRLPHIAQRVVADNPLRAAMRHQIADLIPAIPHRTLEAFTYSGPQLVAGALVLCGDVFLSAVHRDHRLLSHRVRPLCRPEAAGLARRSGAWAGAGHTDPASTRRWMASRELHPPAHAGAVGQPGGYEPVGA